MRYVGTSAKHANGETRMRRTLGLILIGMLLMGPQSAWALANPASVFCAKSGGKTEIPQGAARAGRRVPAARWARGGRVGLLSRDAGEAAALNRAAAFIHPACRRSARNRRHARADPRR